MGEGGTIVEKRSKVRQGEPEETRGAEGMKVSFPHKPPNHLVVSNSICCKLLMLIVLKKVLR